MAGLSTFCGWHQRDSTKLGIALVRYIRLDHMARMAGGLRMLLEDTRRFYFTSSTPCLPGGVSPMTMNGDINHPTSSGYASQLRGGETQAWLKGTCLGETVIFEESRGTASHTHTRVLMLAGTAWFHR